MNKPQMYLAAILLASSSVATAMPLLNADYVRPAPGVTHPTSDNGFAIDAVTGIVYDRDMFQGLPIRTYANVAAFEANISNGSVSNFGELGMWGTYFAAHNGTLYGRGSKFIRTPIDAYAISGPATAGVATPTAFVPLAQMGGTNFADTFDYGGHTGVNAMYSGTHLFYVGGVHNSSDWMVTHFDLNLNALGSVRFASGSVGWGFAIGDYVFLGESHVTNKINRRINVLTGEVSDIDIRVQGLDANSMPIHIKNAAYDPVRDSLYLSSNRHLYKIKGIGESLDVLPDAEVPEPISLSLFGLGLAGVAFSARKRTKITA